MVDLDRLGWAAGLAFVSHGARVGIRVTDPAVLQRLEPYLPPGSKRAPSPNVDYLYSLVVGRASPVSHIRRYHLLYAGTQRFARSFELDELFEPLQVDLEQVVALLARRRLFLRAGAVGWRGRGVLLLGGPAAGTTRLVAELAGVGATYYADGYAVLDTRGRIHPFPTPLALYEDGSPTKRLPVEALGGRAGHRPVPLGLVAALRYQPGARWRACLLSPGQAVLNLLEHTVLARVRPAFALQVLKRALQGATAVKARWGATDEAVERLLKHLKRADVAA
jgi:hypothetical protein